MSEKKQTESADNTSLHNRQFRTRTREPEKMPADMLLVGGHVLRALAVPKHLEVTSVRIITGPDGDPAPGDGMVYCDMRVRLTVEQARAVFGLADVPKVYVNSRGEPIDPPPGEKRDGP